MSHDSLERLRKKNRPSVPPRKEDIEISSDQKSDMSNNQAPHTKPIEPSTSQDVKTNSSQDTNKSRYQDLKTKASTLRLEESIATDLTFFCKHHGISREVLVEAMYIYCKNDPSILESILKEAHARNEQRQQISNRKRAQSMMKRFGQEASDS